jgi:hypothetical protein
MTSTTSNRKNNMDVDEPDRNSFYCKGLGEGLSDSRHSSHFNKPVRLSIGHPPSLSKKARRVAKGIKSKCRYKNTHSLAAPILASMTSIRGPLHFCRTQARCSPLLHSNDDTLESGCTEFSPPPRHTFDKPLSQSQVNLVGREALHNTTSSLREDGQFDGRESTQGCCTCFRLRGFHSRPSTPAGQERDTRIAPQQHPRPPGNLWATSCTQLTRLLGNNSAQPPSPLSQYWD